VIVLEGPAEIAPKKRALVQVVLIDPIVALVGDRFVIRDETNMRTLGGGIVLNPLGRRARKPLDLYLVNLNALGGPFGPGAVEALLNLQDSFAVSPAHIAQLLNTPLTEVEGALKDPRFVKLSLGDEEGFTTAGKWHALARFTLDALAAHHHEQPLSPGLEMEAMRTRLPYDVAPRAFRALVDRLAREIEIVREDSAVRLKSHKVKLGGDVGALGRRIEEILKDADYQPPELKQLAETLKLPPAELPRLRTLLSAMEREGRVVKIAADFYFERSAFERAKAKLLERLNRDGEITAATYRDALNASRKFAIALLDYFDHSGVTTRVGDTRKLRAH
jgi:selenocysteine-specific elongation factor